MDVSVSLVPHGETVSASRGVLHVSTGDAVCATQCESRGGEKEGGGGGGGGWSETIRAHR